MSVNSTATAEVFLADLKGLRKEERDAVLVCIASDRSLRRDLLDLVMIADREQEPSRPFHAYLDERAER